MGKNSNVPVLIKYVNDLEHTWGMYRNVLADWLIQQGLRLLAGRITNGHR